MLTFLGNLGAIILVDLALSGDNALVIGAAAAGLPRRRRLWAITLGGGMAILLRIALAAGATLLLVLPLLSAIGGVVLFVIAGRLLLEREKEAVASVETAKGASEDKSFGSALLTILIADVTMSLDNILAVGGLAHGDLALLGLGLLLSIALLLVGSALVAELIGRLPWLLDVAAVVLGWTGGTMIWHDHIIGPHLAGVPFANVLVPAAGALVTLLIDVVIRTWQRRRVRQATRHMERNGATPLV